MTKTRLLFCLSALVLLTSGSAFAQRTTRSDAMEIRQQCIAEAQSRFPSAGTKNSNREREMAYAACVSKQGVRP